MRKFQQALPAAAYGRRFRIMKDETGDHGGGGQQGGGDSNQQDNNQSGNSGNQEQNQGNGGNQSNNGGGNFDPGSFWNGPADETSSPSGDGGPADRNRQQDTNGNQQQDGDVFRQRLEGLNFGTGVFTPEAVEAMNNGDPATFNTNMNAFGREVTRQAVIMAAQLMQRNNDQLNSRFGSMMDERFGTRDTESDLAKAIPSYSKPGMKPIIDGIMAQALKVTKGKRPEAIEMAKEMLKFQAGALGADFNITTPPGGAGDNFGTGVNTDWASELLGRD